MSTGLDCHIEEREPGVWYIELEQDYGSKLDPEYDTYGPIHGTLQTALAYLRRNFANPGGFSLQFHKDSTDPEAKDR